MRAHEPDLAFGLEPLLAERVAVNGHLVGGERGGAGVGQVRAVELQFPAHMRAQELDLAFGLEPFVAEHIVVYGHPITAEHVPAALLSELISRHISKLQEDGLLFFRMMIVTTQNQSERRPPVSLLHSARGPSSPDACAAGDEGAEDADISSLLGMLASVTDPRSPQGNRQHILEFVLAVCVVAMLAGAKNYREIAGHAADIPQPLLRKLGAEWSWFRLRYNATSTRANRPYGTC